MTLEEMYALLADNSSGDISAEDVRDVVEGLYTQTGDHVADGTAAHAGTAISVNSSGMGNTAAVNAQSALVDFDAAITAALAAADAQEELVADSLTPYQYYDSTPTTGVSANEFSSVTAVFYEPGYADGGQLVPCLPLAALGDPYVIPGDITGNGIHPTPGLLQFTRPGVYMLRAKLRIGTTAPTPAIDAFGYNGMAVMFLSPFDADGLVYAINDPNRPGHEVQTPFVNYDASGTRAVANFFTPVVVPPDEDYTPDPYYTGTTSPTQLEGDGTVVPVGWDLKIEFQGQAPTAWWGASGGITVREVGIWITRVA